MRCSKLSDMKRGWFVGAFSPTVFSTDATEVAVKDYKSGSYEDKHYHKLATEITLIYRGRVKMQGREFVAGDIVTIEPLEVTDFLAITDVTTVVVKVPGAQNDKYMVEE